MEPNYITLAIPFFFLLIGIELLTARLKGKTYYRLNDSISDLACGILNQLGEIFFKTAMFAGYFLIFEHYRLTQWPTDAVWVWVAGFVAVDFIYYWFHRLSHEINFLWACHIVHHQSEEYNLTVALRQSLFQDLFGSFLYWPLAILGMPPHMLIALISFNTLYQFWIHTRTIGKLGPLEAILMTPSHHRVHHGRNPIYIDKNHGGAFILWDKMFGTFQPEEEEVIYGITSPLKSWNPLWANFHYWVDLFRAAGQTHTIKDRVRLFFKPPGWYPKELGGFQPPPPVPIHYAKWDAPFTKHTGLYLFVHFVLTLAASATLLFSLDHLDQIQKVVGAGLSTWSLINIALIFEGDSRGRLLEPLRLILTPILLSAVVVPGVNGLLPIVLSSAALSLIWFFWIHERRRPTSLATPERP